AKIKAAEVKADLILVSHGHGDHLGDTVEIAKRSGATVVSVFELATYCACKGAKAHGMHIGGSHTFDGVKVKLTPAWHGSGFGEGPMEYLGTPCGFVISMDGKNIYHAGDTGLFGDMELIGRLNQIDLALLPIGDNFTMGPEDALEAVNMLKPKLVIPMHYNTWPLIQQDPEKFKSAVEAATGSKVSVIKPGGSLEF
ncbi:MAG: metal-dependent hydrolase, partial [Firmicutes bacterium]|nr:metal-dependent hydrolase [Bacillota bacterium]